MGIDKPDGPHRHSGFPPVVHVSDQGAASPDPIPCTTDLEPSSALGGGSATRSNTEPGPDPAEEAG
jgi:hypothetical protein